MLGFNIPTGNNFRYDLTVTNFVCMPAINQYDLIRSSILEQLSRELRSDLYYHSVDHTIDVEKQAIRIAGELGCSQPDLFLLKLACLYHDSGFLFTYTDHHEEAGCNLAMQQLPAFGVGEQELAVICGLIRATKIPQTPLTPLEEIICDADLDYLGRQDFFGISYCLYLELQVRQLVTNEIAWNKIQVKFFKQHNYFTAVSQLQRAGIKQEHLQIIESELAASI